MLTAAQVATAKALKLSENFNLYELIKSESHPELVEYPNQQVIDQLRLHATTILQPIRNKFGALRVNSGYRNEVLNRAVGGETNSVHQVYYRTVLLGAAVDIVPLEADIIEVFEWAFENVTPMKTIILYRLPSVTNTKFLHTDNRMNRNGRSQFEKFGAGDYRNYIKSDL
jgi:hypothetical protein